MNIYRITIILLLLFYSFLYLSCKKHKNDAYSRDTVLTNQNTNHDSSEKKLNIEQNKKKRYRYTYKILPYKFLNIDYNTGRAFFVIDDTSKLIKEDKNIKDLAEAIAFITQSNKGPHKPIKIAIFSRKPGDPHRKKYEYVGDENQIPEHHKQEWKTRYIADYDCNRDTIVLYPADITRIKVLPLFWRGHRFYKDGRVDIGEDRPFAFDSLFR